jgi:hypothetical protein
MLLAVLLFWLGHLLLLEPIHTEITDNSIKSISFIGIKEPIRTHSEVRFIQIDYGVVFTPRKLTKREKLALALTNMVSNNQ